MPEPLTKTDFMLYLEAPLHLWAARHQQLEASQPTPYQQYLIEQGYRVEALAIQYLQAALADRYHQPEVYHQRTFSDGPYLVRADLVVCERGGEVCDLFEIKSATSVHKEHLVEVAFQQLVCQASLQVRQVFLVHLNKGYVLGDEIDLEGLFVVEEVSAAVSELVAQVEVSRQAAWEAATSPLPDPIPGCTKPKTCPCPELCHPHLPPYPVFDLPRLSKKSAADLGRRGITSITEIPADYPLTANQQRQRAAVVRGEPIIDREAIRAFLAGLRYPLYFLDFETCSPGIPMFPGYRPYQHMTFQYSLHKIAAPGTALQHDRHLATLPQDPHPGLLPRLVQDLGPEGSVLVWNQSFEASRIREMAERYPAYSTALMGINDRLADLMVVFSQGAYVHPDFHGSYSLKTVLPVLLPDFEGGYSDLAISNGEEAMIAWLRIVSGELTTEGVASLAEALLAYNALDTLALVGIWREISRIVGR